ncbi:hypothetical protein BC832DRAFT_589058 [Gaertneriomyces semiglobifer]|nr:hypothetical protein BC832DRAFT_589058 [Gaertneriomyces semiglobifer]
MLSAAAELPSGLDMDMDSMDIDEFLTPSSDVSTFYNDDIASLTQVWINERCAPEILPFEDALVSNLMEMLDAQAANVENVPPTAKDSAFLVVLYQQEMERIKFIIRSYLRTRLAKIQKHTRHYISISTYRERLSPQELAFAEKFQVLLDTHFEKSCVKELPPFLQKLDDQSTEPSMVSSPDIESAVICRVREDVGIFQLDDSTETIDIRKNNIYIMRYKTLRRLLEEGRVDLV